MTLYSLAALALAMFILAATPGPGVFATVSKALSAGFLRTLPLIAGIVFGDLVFLMLAIFGLAAIAATFGLLFTLVKLAGAAYLIWLGIRLWRTDPTDTETPATKQGSDRYSFLVGLSITLGNPKVILFYLAFLPTFVDLTAISGVDLTLVALVVSLVLAAVLITYAYTAARVSGVFRSHGARRRMNRVAGGAMIGAGGVLLLKS